jgi:hypothetical protein
MTTSPTTTSLPPHPFLRAGVALSMIAAAGCGSNDEKIRGPVEVFAVDRSRMPLPGEVVVFADTDGESRSAITDAAGKASGEIEAGGSVWKLRNIGDANMGGTYTAFEDVQPGDTVTFGPPPSVVRPVVATMTLVAAPPEGDFGVRAVTVCGANYNLGTQVQFDDRCGATADVLVLGIAARDAHVSYYKLMPDQPVIDGGTIAVPDGPWQNLDVAAVTFANLGNRTVSDVWVTNEYGLRGTNSSPTAEVANVYLPVVGDELVVSATIRDASFAGQRISVRVPAQVATTVDLNAVLAPFVTQPRVAPFVWSVDDGGGAFSADVKLVEYNWTMQVQNVEAVIRVITISGDVAAGEIGLPRMPEGLDQYQPAPEFTVQRDVTLIRFDDATTADQALDGGSYFAELLVQEGIARSVAVTE